MLAGVDAMPELHPALMRRSASPAAMYASAGPEHRANVATAPGKVKDYAGEVGGAKSQADPDKAAKGFVDFLKIGGKEAADALGSLPVPQAPLL